MKFFGTICKSERNRARKGMTAVELALLLPALLMLIMGIIETGVITYSWLTLQSAAQKGARYAATGQGYDTGTRLTEIKNITEKTLEVLDKGAKKVTIRSWPTHNTSGTGVENNAGEPCQVVEVAATYDYEPFTPLIAQILPETITLLGSDRKVNEPWYPCDIPAGEDN